MNFEFVCMYPKVKLCLSITYIHNWDQFGIGPCIVILK